MLRVFLVSLVLAGLVCTPALGRQNKGYAGGSGGKTIPWSNKVEESIQAAKKSRRPIMFYVEGETRTTNDQHSLSDDIRKACADPKVLYATGFDGETNNKRFVAIKVIRSHSGYKSLFQQLNVPETANQVVVYATPEGERLDEFGAWTQPDSFAQKSSLVFRSYRKKLFADELKPKLDKKETADAEIKRILKIIEDFNITDADETLISRKFSEPQVKDLYDTLGELSTNKAVDFLIEKATEASAPKSSAAAADALMRCTPAAAEYMTKALSDDDAAKRLVIYKALVKICKVPSPKPDKFWDGKNEKLKKDEIERVKKEVEKDARRWERVAEYR